MSIELPIKWVCVEFVALSLWIIFTGDGVYGFMGTALWYFGLLAIGWGMVGASIWFLSRQMQRYAPPIPAIIWLIGIILAANILSLSKATFIPGSSGDLCFVGCLFSSSNAWERGWPFRWYGVSFLGEITSPYYLLFDTVWWTISTGGWSYLTVRHLPSLRNRYHSRLFVIASIGLALMSAYSLPFLLPALK